MPLLASPSLALCPAAAAAVQELLRLAEANLSAQAKKAREERERLAAAELAAKLVGANGCTRHRWLTTQISR